ncbi:tyrosine-type recombinase/integrase [Terribacillus sp. DMT04]|uniref:tyrosine-type recombinase/integrase n=1 Tax=Terribacillus sp. DMT04 TaxID=2850441 RepID=UPI001C2C939E|nr:tyrosine-type recombinase/integrase [Terribacillus sp. DMT04]QXE01729.1 tyrosine-type recombinase/integrase [Terribacillus sp. DMT04]
MPSNSRKGKPIVTTRKAREISDYIPLQATIEESFQSFLSLKKSLGVRKRTVSDYHHLMDYFLSWLNENHPEIEMIHEINTAIIREYLLYLREERYNDRTKSVGLSPFTINVRIRFLKTFFNALYKEEVINNNPTRNIQLMKVDEDGLTPLTDEEVNKLISVPDEQYYAQFRDLVMMYLMLDTGMRINEVCELENRDIDFKTRAIILPATKNKNRKPRILPLSNQVVKLLLELVAENKANFDTEYVFVSNIGTRYNPNSFRKRLNNYKDLAGITKRVSPHVFRHMFCRNYIMNGGDIFTLQRIVGHADISTTRKYIQLDDKAIRQQHTLYSPAIKLRRNRNGKSSSDF